MSLGTFSYPMPANEPVLNYAPGSKERKLLKATLKKLKNEEARYSDVYRRQRSKNE